MIETVDMKGLENNTYLFGYIISNVVAIIMLWATWKNGRTGRFLFFLLFAWASVTNASFALNQPEAYLEYGNMAWLNSYKQFIHGWFSEHIALTVGFVAVSQGLIAVSMWLKGLLLKVGATGAIIFLLAILPLGVGSGAPCTFFMAIGMFLILRRKESNFLWINPKKSQPYPLGS